MRYSDLVTDQTQQSLSEANRAEELRQRLLHDPTSILPQTKPERSISSVKTSAFQRGFRGGLAKGYADETGVPEKGMDAFKMGVELGTKARDAVGEVPPNIIVKNRYGETKPNQAFVKLYKEQLAIAMQDPEVMAMLNEIQESELNEGYRGDWAILPATMELYGKRVVDIITAASEWMPGPDTILVCTKVEHDGRRRFCFVSSCGDGFDYYAKDIGKAFSTYHDQTGASKGMYRLENVVVIQDNKIVKKANETGINVKASLSVFK